MFRLQTTVATIHIDVAAVWTERLGSIDSYANVHPTRGGGSHVEGLLQGLIHGLARALDPAAHSMADLRQVIEAGLIAVVQVRLADPTFGAPTKDLLSTPAVGTVVSAAVAEAFADFLCAVPVAFERLRARLPGVS